jgi:hypothetical protein
VHPLSGMQGGGGIRSIAARLLKTSSMYSRRGGAGGCAISAKDKFARPVVVKVSRHHHRGDLDRTQDT